jgi:hypothetical protein
MNGVWSSPPLTSVRAGSAACAFQLRNRHPLGVCRDPVTYPSLLFCFDIINTNHRYHTELRLFDTSSHVDPVAIPWRSCRINGSAENEPLVDEKAGHASRSRVQLSKACPCTIYLGEGKPGLAFAFSRMTLQLILP